MRNPCKLKQNVLFLIKIANQPKCFHCYFLILYSTWNINCSREWRKKKGRGVVSGTRTANRKTTREIWGQSLTFLPTSFDWATAENWKAAAWTPKKHIQLMAISFGLLGRPFVFSCNSHYWEYTTRCNHGGTCTKRMSIDMCCRAIWAGNKEIRNAFRMAKALPSSRSWNKMLLSRTCGRAGRGVCIFLSFKTQQQLPKSQMKISSRGPVCYSFKLNNNKKKC